jgi:hypothetical protein
MSDEQFAYLLFGAGFVLMVVSMIAGPFGVTKWAIFAATVACCFAIAATSIGFLTWDEPPEIPPKEENPEKENRDGHLSK